MRVEASVTSVSWIPSEAISGLPKAGFLSGVLHYDDPPPDHLDSIAALHDAEAFRFANHLAAWIDVDDGRIVDAGYAGQGYITRTRAGRGRAQVVFQPVAFPDLQGEPDGTPSRATFVQTTGGRTGLHGPDRCVASPSSSGHHPPCGRRCASRSTPTARRPAS